jgi:streptomycin 6-kinase
LEDAGRQQRALAARAQDWGLRPDGPAVPGVRAALPVTTAEGEPALLELVTDGDPAEHLALRAWAGEGAVRLLRADPRQGALLTERTDPGDDLTSRPVLEACETVAGLMAVLHRPALPQPPRLPDLAPGWADDLDALAGTGLVPRRFVDQARHWAGELTADPAAGATLLHGDLRPGTVRAGRRTPWLAVAPRPVGGEPGYEVAPLLRAGWAEAAAGGDLRAALVDRLYAVVDAAGLDEDRTRAWVCVRTMVELAAAVLRGGAGPDDVTRALTLVKAVQR